MSQRLISLLGLGTALGAGLVAGTFFAFSTFVMAGLVRLPAAQGIAAMQSINVTVINRLFLGVLLGTTAACVVLAIAALAGWNEPGAGLRLAGSLFYLAGCFAVTMTCNVPRNNALAALSPDSSEAALLWPRFVAEWMFWNHVRTGGALMAAALLILALLARTAPRGVVG